MDAVYRSDSTLAPRMKGAGFGQGVTGLAGMRGDTGRMAHPSGAAIEASFRGRKGEVVSLGAVCRSQSKPSDPSCSPLDGILLFTAGTL